MRIQSIVLKGAGLILAAAMPALPAMAKGPPAGAAYDDDVTAPGRPLPPPDAPAYEGRWSGTWRDRDGRTYSGDYEGRFEGHVQGRPGVDYDAPPYAAAPRPVGPPPASGQPAPGQPVVTTTQAPGYVANGYYYPGATTTTVVVQPATTTTRTYVTETMPARKTRRHMRLK